MYDIELSIYYSCIVYCKFSGLISNPLRTPNFQTLSKHLQELDATHLSTMSSRCQRALPDLNSELQI